MRFLSPRGRFQQHSLNCVSQRPLQVRVDAGCGPQRPANLSKPAVGLTPTEQLLRQDWLEVERCPSLSNILSCNYLRQY